MKKATRKIKIRRETLRVLGGMELVAIAGGDTGDPVGGCVKPQLVDTGDPVGSCVNAKG